MLTKSHLHHALAPACVLGLLAASALAAPTPASATPTDRLAGALVSAAPAAATAAAARTEASPERSPQATPAAYRVVPGTKLHAKPPPWVLPVRGYHLTGRFGASSGLWSSTHTGLDFAAPEGTEIRSIGPGTVLSTAYDGAYGNKTVVRLTDGTVLWYCHQSEFGVQPGQQLAPGDLVGYVGSTGNTTGPHLHLEVHPGGGDPVDPEAWLPRHHLHP